MDAFDMADIASVSQQPLLFGSYPQPSHIKRQQQLEQQSFPSNFSVPLYSPLEGDFSSGPDFATDSAPSPGSGSPCSPVFGGGYSLPVGGDEWAVNWDKLECNSPTDSDNFFKTETGLESPDLTSIPIMSPALNPMDLGNSVSMPPIEEAVVFGREGVNDTRPLFTSPTQQMPSFNIPQQQQQQQQQQNQVPTQQAERRYPARTSLKRKSASDDCSSTPSSPRSSCSPPPPQRRHTNPTSTKDEVIAATKPSLGPKKTAHNMIEKRYRTNLNDKIAALRDSVPALRVMVHRLENADDASPEEMIKTEDIAPGDEDLGGLAPAHKLNKATILSKATEYIAHLERKNRNLAKENSALRNRVEGFEMLVMSRGGSRGVWN